MYTRGPHTCEFWTVEFMYLVAVDRWHFPLHLQKVLKTYLIYSRQQQSVFVCVVQMDLVESIHIGNWNSH